MLNVEWFGVPFNIQHSALNIQHSLLSSSRETALP
jgi:hypothetical protein